MKKITLSIFMFAMTLVSFSQTELAVNGDFETGDDTGWLLFQNGGTVSIDNTIANGGTWSGKLETGGPSNPAFKQEFIGAGSVAAGDDVTVSFDHIGSVVPPGAVFNVLLFGEGAGGASFTHVFNPAPTLGGSWTTFSETYTIPPGTDVSSGISFLIEAVCGGDAGCSVSANIDNVSVIVDSAPATCDDGIQNGQETGVDCGGPDCPPCSGGDPTVGPGNNGSTGTDFYIYSELSGNANSSDFAAFNLVDFAGGAVISEVDLNGDTVLRVDNLDFFGSGFGETFNATGTYDFLHINYYATTATAFNVSLVDDSLANGDGICCGNPEEPFYRFGVDEPLLTDQWVSVFIPLDHFANFPDLVSGIWDGTDLIQTLITGNGTVFIDNIFFSTTNTLSADSFELTDFSVAPNPTSDRWVIKTSNDQNLATVVVFDILGKEVIRVTPNSNEVEINASDLRDGIYLAKLTSANGTRTVKLVKN